jgi:hypothetical protein
VSFTEQVKRCTGKTSIEDWVVDRMSFLSDLSWPGS